MASYLLIVALWLLRDMASALYLVPCQAFRQSTTNGGFLVYQHSSGISTFESCQWTTADSTSNMIFIDVTQPGSRSPSCNMLQIVHENGSLSGINCSKTPCFFARFNQKSVTFRLIVGPDQTATHLLLFYSYSERNRSCQFDNNITNNGGMIRSSSSSCAWYITNASLPALPVTKLTMNSRNGSSPKSHRCNNLSVYSLDGWFLRTYTVAQTTWIPYSTFILTCSYDPAGGDALDVTYTFRPAHTMRGARDIRTTTRTQVADWALLSSPTTNAFPTRDPRWKQWLTQRSSLPSPLPWTSLAPRTWPTVRTLDPRWEQWLSWTSSVPSALPWTSKTPQTPRTPWTPETPSSSSDSAGFSSVWIAVMPSIIIIGLWTICALSMCGCSKMPSLNKRANVPPRTQAGRPTQNGLQISPDDSSTSTNVSLTNRNQFLQPAMLSTFNSIRNAASNGSTEDTSFSNTAYSFSSDDPIDVPPSYDDVVNESSSPSSQANESNESQSDRIYHVQMPIYV